MRAMLAVVVALAVGADELGDAVGTAKEAVARCGAGLGVAAGVYRRQMQEEIAWAMAQRDAQERLEPLLRELTELDRTRVPSAARWIGGRPTLRAAREVHAAQAEVCWLEAEVAIEGSVRQIARIAAAAEAAGDAARAKRAWGESARLDGMVLHPGPLVAMAADGKRNTWVVLVQARVRGSLDLVVETKGLRWVRRVGGRATDVLVDGQPWDVRWQKERGWRSDRLAVDWPQGTRMVSWIALDGEAAAVRADGEVVVLDGEGERSVLVAITHWRPPAR